MKKILLTLTFVFVITLCYSQSLKEAAQFVQVENYFLAAVQYELSTQLPFIDELK